MLTILIKFDSEPKHPHPFGLPATWLKLHPSKFLVHILYVLYKHDLTVVLLSHHRR